MKVDGASRSYPSLIENIHVNMNISIFEALYETEYNIIKGNRKALRSACMEPWLLLQVE